MPIAYLLKDDLLLFKAEGDVTVKDFYRTWSEVAADKSCQVPLNTLIDLRKARIDVPGQEIERIVNDLKHKRFFNKMGFVAERGSFTYAMGRMFCINAEYVGCRSEIFLNMIDALAWLDGDGLGEASAVALDTTWE